MVQFCLRLISFCIFITPIACRKYSTLLYELFMLLKPFIPIHRLWRDRKRTARTLDYLGRAMQMQFC
uniref:Putative secreted protein n=1 Tax=Anopheles triannulatus TaxID=58253 RepID=A0A2M4B493_9DIPT